MHINPMTINKSNALMIHKTAHTKSLILKTITVQKKTYKKFVGFLSNIEYQKNST